MKTPIVTVEYFTGLDLGTPGEFTALAVLERTTRFGSNREAPQGTYAVRLLERFPLGTPYHEFCRRLQEHFGKPPLAYSQLAVDRSAVGEPVVELLRRGQINADITSVAVTAGHRASFGDGFWMVPKQELVSMLQVLLQSHRLKVAPTLAEAQTLVEELMNFKMKVPLAQTDLLAWREAPNDDLVLATAVAVWIGERSPSPQGSVPRVLLTSPW